MKDISQVRERKLISPIYTFETVDPASVKAFSRPQTATQKPPTEDNQQQTAHLPEQLSFPFCKSDLFPNIRLYEPIETLKISSFLLSKIKAAGVDTLEELLAFIKKEKTLPSQLKKERLAPTLLKEIEEKAMAHTVQGAPLTPTVDWIRMAQLVAATAKTLRLDQLRYKNFFLRQSNVPELSSSSCHKIYKNILNALEAIWTQAVAPWIVENGGVVDQDELMNTYLLLAEGDTTTSLSNTVRALELLASLNGTALLFSDRLVKIDLFKQLTAPVYSMTSSSERALLKIVAQAAEIFPLLRPSEAAVHPSSIMDLRNYILQSSARAWQQYDPLFIGRVLFWYLEQHLNMRRSL